MAREARRAGWDGTRLYGSTVRRAWQAYARDLLREIDRLGVDIADPATSVEVDILLGRLRRVAAGRYVSGEALRRAGTPAVRASIVAALGALRSVGMPAPVEQLLLAPADPIMLSGRASVPLAETGRVSVGAVLGAITDDSRGLLAAWGEEGASLILGAQEAVIERIALRATDIVAEGQRWESMIDLVRGSIDATEARVRLIARDQVAKIGAQVTEEMHARAGVTHYIWRASRDERTRRIHREANGHEVAWASAGWPGADFYGTPAHAGMGGQCRCTAEPVAPESWGRWASRRSRQPRAA